MTQSAEHSARCFTRRKPARKQHMSHPCFPTSYLEESKLLPLHTVWARMLRPMWKPQLCTGGPEEGRDFGIEDLYDDNAVLCPVSNAQRHRTLNTHRARDRAQTQQI